MRKTTKPPDREVADRILSLIILEIITVNRLRCAIGGELLSFISIWPEEREMRSLRLFYVINRSRNDAEQT